MSQRVIDPFFMSTYNLLDYQGKQSLPQGMYCQVGEGSCKHIAVMSRSTDEGLAVQSRDLGKVSWKS